MSQAMVGETKLVTTTIASGQATSSGFHAGGFRKIAVEVPVLTSAWLALIGEHGAGFKGFVDNAGALVTGFTPGGTGGVLAGSQDAWLTVAEGYHGELRISAGANQAADRTFKVRLKG